jgi:transketolase
MRATALETVFELALNDSRIVFIGSDLGHGTLVEMQKKLPNQFFMEGISEQYIIGFAAGLAKEGFIPFVNTIATFLSRRALEQIAMDIALHRLPVKLLASGGGMVYAPLGPTHTAIEDISLMSSIPNLDIYSPCDAVEMKKLIKFMVTDSNPAYIRLGKGGEKNVTKQNDKFSQNPLIFQEDADIKILTTGILLQQCLGAQEILSKQNIKLGVIHFPFLNFEKISDLNKQIGVSKYIIVAEEHVPVGGLLTKYLHLRMNAASPPAKILHLSLPGDYSHQYGNQQDHLISNELTSDKIALSILRFLRD